MVTRWDGVGEMSEKGDGIEKHRLVVGGYNVQHRECSQ